MASEVFNGEDLILVEGVLSDVLHARTRVNLLQQVDKHVKTKSLASGVAAGLNAMPGLLANSAMVALYDGEDTFNFAGLLGEQVICGTFEGADSLKDGDRIKAVVSKRADVMRAHAVMREDDKMLFMPLMTHAGKRAHLRYFLRSGKRASIFSVLFFWVAGLFMNAPAVVYFLVLAAMPLLVMPVELWTYHSTRHVGEYASAIFRVFGLPRPDDLDLIDSIHVFFPGDRVGAEGAFNYERALEQHRKRYKLTGTP